jgi:hypothetical protein
MCENCEPGKEFSQFYISIPLKKKYEKVPGQRRGGEAVGGKVTTVIMNLA